MIIVEFIIPLAIKKYVFFRSEKNWSEDGALHNFTTKFIKKVE
jgi:hypothetical protein